MQPRYTNRGNKPTKTGFGEGIRQIANKYGHVIGLGADITNSVGMNLFAGKYPEQFYSIGIAEQNCVGIAAGLALAGKLPVFSTYGVFAALRTTDQLRISICYNDLHVIIGGAHAGISVGPDGATHQALEDIAVMRALPNMVVLSPCDATQTTLACMAAAEQTKHPVYIRFGREAVPDFTFPDKHFIIGKGELLKEGKDITLIATGHMTWEALEAAYKMDSMNISVRVINMPTIKPIDEEIIIQAAKDTGKVITIEEHQVTGGLGSAVSEVLSKKHPTWMDIIGMNDCFGESGKPEELMHKYGLHKDNIVIRTKAMLGKS